MSNYKHLTREERYQIQAYRKAGFSQVEIAKELIVHKSTISRELKRNSSKVYKRYSAQKADKVSCDRRMYASKESNRKMTKVVIEHIEKYIVDDFSPEQTSATLKMRDGLEISHVRIYQYIREDKLKGGDLHTHLRFHHTGKRRAVYGAKHKGRIKDRVSISQRPKIVEDKIRLGDFEIDTIIGTNKKGAISTAVDRVSLLSIISIPTTKKADEVEAEIKRILTPIKDKIQTITSDNGLEFSNHKNISQALDCESPIQV